MVHAYCKHTLECNKVVCGGYDDDCGTESGTIGAGGAWGGTTETMDCHRDN